MTNYEWLIQKGNLVNVFDEYFIANIINGHCKMCVNRIFCEECTLNPVDIFMQWLDLKHQE